MAGKATKESGKILGLLPTNPRLVRWLLGVVSKVI